MAVMKSSLVGSFLLLLLSCAVSGLGSVVSRTYSYIQTYSTWQEAQSYCRSSDGQSDLATFYTESDSGTLYLESYYAWIGLHRNTGGNSWTWTKGGNLNFNPWAIYEPNNNENCSYIYYNGTYGLAYSDDCQSYYFFICDHSNFKPESKTWSDARDSCQNTDLANYKNQGDLNGNVHQQVFPVWIGLHREGKTWKWSAGVSNYTNWAPGEPKTNGDCVTISSDNKQMATQNCSNQFPFICYEDNLVLVNENKTWEEALEYCRNLSSSTQPELRYELVSVQPEDYDYMRTRLMEANTEEVWTGLRFLAGEWLWVNGADMMYSDLPLCPSILQRCGIFSKNGTGSMETRDCTERRNFLCYRM